MCRRPARSDRSLLPVVMAVVGAALLVMTGCSTSRPPGPIPGQPASSSDISGTPAPQDVLVPPQLRWTTRLSKDYPDGRHTEATGKWFFVSANDANRRDWLNAAVGRISDGGVVRELALSQVLATPAFCVVDRRPMVFVLTGTGTGTDSKLQVGAWDAISGKRIWRRQLPRPETFNLAGCQGRRVFLSLGTPETGSWVDYHIAAFDTHTGEAEWRTVTPVRQVFLGPTTLATLVRTDGSLEGNANQIQVRSLRTGRVIATTPWIETRPSRPTATALSGGRWLLLRNDLGKNSAAVAVIRRDGTFVWRSRSDGVPAVDGNAGIVAHRTVSGSTVGQRIADGQVAWRLDPEQTEATGLNFSLGAHGWLVGTAGGTDVVFKSQQGVPWFSGTFDGTDPHRWARGTYVAWAGPRSLSGVSGVSFPPAEFQDTPDGLVFLRR